MAVLNVKIAKSSPHSQDRNKITLVLLMHSLHTLKKW